MGGSGPGTGTGTGTGTGGGSGTVHGRGRSGRYSTFLQLCSGPEDSAATDHVTDHVPADLP